MNFNKEYNTFSDIPGFDASKGERIVNALQKLWKKIEYLEQNRISEKKSRSEVSRCSKDEDLTITDVQYKLLVLQLQYARSILRKNQNQNSDTLHPNIHEVEQRSLVSDNDNLRLNNSQKSFKNKSISPGIPAVQNPAEEHISLQRSTLKEASKRLHDQIPGTKLSTAKHVPENSIPVTQQRLSSSSKSHYHLKLDDVPFILGASSTASHSVVANVQNIIAMMKSHHKSLCGPKHSSTKSSVGNSQPTRSIETIHLEGDSQDTTKMLNELSQDLHELALKQQRLYEFVHATTEKNQGSNVTKDLQKEKKLDNVTSANVKKQISRRVRSNSESETKLQAEVNYLPKMNQLAKRNTQENQNNFIRSQPSSLSIMGRRKLLRSLQNFKTHLSEDDISWN